MPGHCQSALASYPELASFIRRFGAHYPADAQQLYRRMIFNILVGNTDDHARNHAFFWDGHQYRLTPAYDICPMLRTGQTASQGMIVGDKGRESTLRNALSLSEQFGISRSEAKSIQEELNYDTSQMASFYLTNYKWEKEKEVTLFEMFSDKGNGNGMLKMDTTLLEDYLNIEKSRLLYIHDFFFERAFNIELVSINKQNGSLDYPKCTRLEGTVPEQVMMPDMIPNDIADIIENEDDISDDDMFQSLDDLNI